MSGKGHPCCQLFFRAGARAFKAFTLIGPYIPITQKDMSFSQLLVIGDKLSFQVLWHPPRLQNMPQLARGIPGIGAVVILEFVQDLLTAVKKPSSPINDSNLAGISTCYAPQSNPESTSPCGWISHLKRICAGVARKRSAADCTGGDASRIIGRHRVCRHPSTTDLSTAATLETTDLPVVITPMSYLVLPVLPASGVHGVACKPSR